MHLKLPLTLVALALPLLVSARPAAWYWWTSRLDGQHICAQTAPAKGWLRAGGPFADSRCSHLPRRLP